MPKLNISQQTALNNLLAKGEFSEASKFLASLADPNAPDPAIPAAAEEPKPPRPANEIIVDAFKCFHSLLGNNPGADAILAELEAVLTPPKPAGDPGGTPMGNSGN